MSRQGAVRSSPASKSAGKQTTAGASDAAAKKKKDLDLNDLLGKRVNVADTRKELRDKHCKGPGKPSDYSFVVSSSCRPKPGTAAYSAAEAKRHETAYSSPASRRPISARQNLKELIAVANFLQTEVAVPLELNTWNYSMIAPIFDQMVENRYRKQVPDPVERYKNIVQGLIREMKKRSDVIIHFDTMPRHVVFMQLLSHLKNLELPKDTPQELLDYHPIYNASAMSPR